MNTRGEREVPGPLEGTIVRLTSKMREARRAVARLHQAELGASDLAALGEEFLERFYYGALLEDPAYFCYLCTVSGEPAGFTTFSTDASGVAHRGVRRAWGMLAWVVIKRVARHPSRLGSMLALARGWLSMRSEALAEVKAEAMTTAVAAAYRTQTFHQRTGINVAQALYLTMARVLLAEGVKTVKGFTLASNVRVTTALSFMGWRKVREGQQLRATVKEPTCVWLWDLEQAARRFNLSADAETLDERDEAVIEAPR